MGTFPFPSNGIAQGHEVARVEDSSLVVEEFPFPSNGKAQGHYGKRIERRRYPICFHSLQTGKHMCTDSKLTKIKHGICFHSLQTGKHMCTEPSRHCLPRPEYRKVSIPFKRESTCAPKKCLWRLSTGSGVSIPFKRDSTCAPRRHGPSSSRRLRFHSLQTG